MRTLAVALLLAAAAPAPAQEIVTPQEFREYADGYTLHFEREGEFFGSEKFEASGRTRWRFTDGSCVRGVWQAHGAQICFLYEIEQGPEPLCWRMLRDEEGLLARLLNGPDAGMELRVIRRDRAPLLCGEPGRST